MPCILASASPVEPIFVMLGLVLAAAVVVSLVFARLRQSLILGYFLCGIVLGNSGLMEYLPLGNTGDLIAVLADTGIILLMFTLGIEFSFTELQKLRRVALIGGGVQMALTFGAGWLMFFFLARDAAGLAALPAFMVALSSTALALKMFQEAGQATGQGARLSLGIALFQDLAVIVFILLMPALFGQPSGGGLGAPLGSALLRGLVFCLFAWAAMRWLVPGLLGSVTATRSRELFTLTVIALCAGIASLGWGLGLSLALGAFVAGLVVSETVYSHRILADVLPFKDLFLALFFISVGLMIELPVFFADWPFLVSVALGLFVLKALLAFFAGRAAGYPVRACVQAGLALGSIGEFSLVLVNKALGLGVFDPGRQQFFLIVTALSMAMAPLAMKVAPALGRRLEEWPVFKHHVRPAKGSAHSMIPSLQGHAIICGYGPVGRRLDEALRRAGIATVIVELNVDTVKELKAAGQPVLFADAAQSETLPLAGLERAGLLAITFPHYEAARAITAHARSLCPEIPIFCRVKFDKEVDGLRHAGVECIVQDELESAVGMVHKALGHFSLSPEEIRNEEDMLRYRGGVEG